MNIRLLLPANLRKERRAAEMGFEAGECQTPRNVHNVQNVHLNVAPAPSMDSTPSLRSGYTTAFTATPRHVAPTAKLIVKRLVAAAERGTRT
jgi:hypothetical protein